MFYFYTPSFIGNPPGAVDPDTGDTWNPAPVRQPGEDTGSGTVFLTDVPTGMAVLRYDDPASRCVVALHANTPRAGWIAKTSGEVLADYPGLPGVV